MPVFIPGQRWISDTEPELGLGMVISSENHRATLLFIATGDRRTYAIDNAPLTRVRFAIGDLIETGDGLKLTVAALKETAGILTYTASDETGSTTQVEEMDLSHFMLFNRPQERLFTGQLDSSDLFELRQEAYKRISELEQSPVRGLIGSRTSLIPHQLFIAHEVTHRDSPRVLLADEVGLGKTIEAGLIIHHQLLTGRSERVLILVPEPLLHQWLVEMRRRFNLKFSLFDGERYRETSESNPFLSEQLILTSIDFLLTNTEYQQKAIEAGWDLCVVDEAHHLDWTPEHASPHYQFVEALSAQVAGLLLLTATPEQLGKPGHFARLRLLDPDRFHSYTRFLEEERDYEALADLINHLLDDPKLDPVTLAQLGSLTQEDIATDLLARIDDPAHQEPARHELIQLLLDRHGTGRVLFRNSRATIRGFPRRELHATALKPHAALASSLDDPKADLEQRLHPELNTSQGTDPDSVWWRNDPRVGWLVETLKKLNPAKALVICSRPETSVDLENALRLAGIHSAIFNERLSIVARDRAAAWFADPEEGAQALICSEIGSEGRNFQFAHHLILFDLPLNPDLLEQRIGRLDRIGQTETIRIHLAYFEKSPQAVLFRWYHEGLNAFNQINPAASILLPALRERLITQLDQPDPEGEEALIRLTQKRSADLQRKLHKGRDRLLEIHSCQETEATRWVQRVRQIDTDDRLWSFMERIFDAYGVNVLEHSDQCFILQPGEQMRTQFPELPDEGVTVTLNRNIALAREDMLFLTWEHPMVGGALDLLLNSEHGNASIAILRHPDFEPGELLLECYHLIDSPAPRHLQLARFFPPRILRSLFDQHNNSLASIPAESFTPLHHRLDREHAQELVRSQRRWIERSIQEAERSARQHLPSLIETTSQRMVATMTGELKRLAALRKVNANVRQEELDQLKARVLEMHACIQSANLRLDAVRLIVTA